MEIYHYRNLTFEVPVLPNTGSSFRVAYPTGQHREPGMELLGSEWDLREFDRPHAPVSVGPLGRWGFPPRQGLRILDMPIKMAGGVEYRLPGLTAAYLPLAHLAALIEAQALDPTPYYCYLTLDEVTVRPGETARNPGCHVDGFQGDRIQPKHAIDHSYVAVDVLPFAYYDQAFPCAHLDPARHDFFKYWDKIAQPDCKRLALPNVLYGLTAYVVHEATPNRTAAPLQRAFFRMTYSLREFDRLGNTHNPMFDYSWPMVPRETAESLTVPEPLGESVP